MVGAVATALLSALCFAAGATLQQGEALRAATSGVADPRLLWRLAHRPLWLAGVAADALSAALHVVALSLGSIALVQPLGVTGLLFAIPMVAVARRRRVRPQDLGAALVVLVALAVLLNVLPAAATVSVRGGGATAAVLLGTLVFAGAVIGMAQVWAGRPRALLLAAGAGAAFGMTAVLVRALLQVLGRPGAAVELVVAAAATAVLIPTGYLLLQNAYRAGQFAASLATAVVMDPVAAVIGGGVLLGEPFPHTPGRVALVVGCALAVVAAITLLVRSPAQVFTVAKPTRRAPG